MLAPYEQHARTKLIAIVVSIIVIAGVIMLADHLKSKTPALATTSGQTSQPTAQTNTTSTTNMPTATPPSTSPGTGSSYSDGSYSATSDYYVPHGDEEIRVNLTLQNGVVTAASIQNSESNRDSAMFQEDFASEYKQFVIGKKISSLNLSNIAGASDTTQAFNEAVSQIASKAQA